MDCVPTALIVYFVHRLCTDCAGKLTTAATDNPLPNKPATMMDSTSSISMLTAKALLKIFCHKE